ncbi:hypothetical protein FO519_001165 [Halicephalobus sp. NKZ332]|nr:hypothetical protein FO519_001165 [Halicephalobus sp. NKZ332]
MEDGIGHSMEPGKREVLRSAPLSKDEQKKEDEIGSQTIAAGAATGGILGSFLPVIGTAVGATIGAGVGFIVAMTSKEAEQSKRPQYKALSCKDEED